MMNVLDIFSGIGRFSLGLERTGGFKTVAFCEIEPFCRRVLNKHWPNIPVYEDVRRLTAEQLTADGISVDIICGGFPCQDISLAGKGAGIAGERSGLWKEYARLIGELRPRYVIVENVSALLTRGLSVVLGDLASLGYDAEWHCIPASYVGAPHRRDRLWIVAYATGQRSREARADSGYSAEWISGSGAILADPASCEKGAARSEDSISETYIRWPLVTPQIRGRDGLCGRAHWDTEPDVCRVADGLSANVDRDCALGNAVVPQIPEILGNAILSAEAA